MRFRQFDLPPPSEIDKPFRARVSPFEVAVEHHLDRDRFSAPFEKLNVSFRPNRPADYARIVEGVADVGIARVFDPRLSGPQEAVRPAAGELVVAAADVIEHLTDWPDAERFRLLAVELAAHRGPYVLELCRTKPRGRAREIVTWLRIDEDESVVYHTGPGGNAHDTPVVIKRSVSWDKPAWMFPVRRCVVRGAKIAYLRSDGSTIATAPIEPSAG